VASPLENLSGPGRPLQKEAPDAKEFAGLKRSALARLTDSARWKVDLILPITPPMRFVWPPYVGMDTGRAVATSSFRHYRTLSDWVLKFGVCSTNVIQFVILSNMKVILMSMNGLWRI
jgi:hypothetical protein